MLMPLVRCNSTMKEAMLFHHLKGIGRQKWIYVEAEKIDWDRKNAVGLKFRISSPRISTSMCDAIVWKGKT